MEHAAEHRGDEEPEGVEDGDGLAGKTEDRFAVTDRQDRRLAGPDVDSVDEHARASQTLDHRRGEVLDADGAAGVDQEHLAAVEGLPRRGLEGTGFIGDDATPDGEGAELSNEGGERVAVQ